MEFLAELWLPILLSAVAVFVISSIIHMVIPIHKDDFQGLPNEDKALDSIRSMGIGAGNYVFPMCKSMKDMKDPAMMEKMKRGPTGFLTIMPAGGCNIGKSLIQWFLFSIGMGVVTAFIASIAFDHAASRMHVGQVCAAAATMGYGFSHITDGIWKGVNWKCCFKFVFDGLLYGLATGAIFAWLWPRG